jgi:hypothetical protein
LAAFDPEVPPGQVEDFMGVVQMPFGPAGPLRIVDKPCDAMTLRPCRNWDKAALRGPPRIKSIPIATSQREDFP